MKVLLVGEYREGKLREESYDLVAFADSLGAQRSMVLVAPAGTVPTVDGTLYIADAAQCGEYNPEHHKRIILAAVEREDPDCIAFVHSSYGWDLAPRLAVALGAAQVSEVVAVAGDGAYEVNCCNAKLRRAVTPKTPRTILTIQAGAFSLEREPAGMPAIVPLDVPLEPDRIQFDGYEAAEKKGVDLGRAEIVVSAGRGVGKKENVGVIAELAKVLGGELGASRPVVDAKWVDHSHQVGTTGQVVSPKLYVACGISGAIQHVAGMKKADFVVAINKDRDAPIGEVADVLVVADVMQFVPALTARVMR
ncbi:electron transfer flavoprotein subunit alpha/FixB family protein [Geobacter grbiciae]|uniref:electron transfer flavoprotein subunit alpha/FixB family protein n=1 Tax=Geobacter grbiciae TaxID=155042 RepID=UPI001C029350|nr:electron transfer flavoprotein subunit alpha/FixB family protein [Geobacter grbiciae]MBT1074176.1 electron transfer flavoprotein subunit alpha/FixB family protein [Geobacter grbiciae]